MNSKKGRRDSASNKNKASSVVSIKEKDISDSLNDISSKKSTSGTNESMSKEKIIS